MEPPAQAEEEKKPSPGGRNTNWKSASFHHADTSNGVTSYKDQKRKGNDGGIDTYFSKIMKQLI